MNHKFTTQDFRILPLASNDENRRIGEKQSLVLFPPEYLLHGLCIHSPANRQLYLHSNRPVEYRITPPLPLVFLLKGLERSLSMCEKLFSGSHDDKSCGD